MAGAVTTKWSWALPAGSPMAKSPKESMPVAWVLVNVRVPVASGVQTPPEYPSTMTCSESTNGSRSPGAKVKVAE